MRIGLHCTACGYWRTVWKWEGLWQWCHTHDGHAGHLPSHLTAYSMEGYKCFIDINTNTTGCRPFRHTRLVYSCFESVLLTLFVLSPSPLSPHPIPPENTIVETSKGIPRWFYMLRCLSDRHRVHCYQSRLGGMQKACRHNACKHLVLAGAIYNDARDRRPGARRWNS